MCEFASWIEKDGDVFFLTDKDLKPKKLKEYKEYNRGWQEDLKGHWAIRWFYPMLEKVGKEKECTDFSDSSNFPKDFVNAIKNMEITRFGIDLRLLNDKGKAEYKKIQKPAWAEYEDIRLSAWAEYNEIQESARAEYERIQASAFWKIFKQKKYRNKKWM